MTEDEIALHLAIIILNDSAECRRMPSGQSLDGAEVDLHGWAAEQLKAMVERLVAREAGRLN
jgi:hypothetical protein